MGIQVCRLDGIDRIDDRRLPDQVLYLISYTTTLYGLNVQIVTVFGR